MVQEGAGRGTRLLRALAIVVLAVLVLYVLFFHVFPRVERYLEDPTLGSAPVTFRPVAPLSDDGRG